MNRPNESPLTFGIYPFGVVGTAQGLASGRPDDIAQIGRAISDLGGGKTLLPRTYVLYGGRATSESVLNHIGAYVRVGVKWDLVLRFTDSGSNLEPWKSLIRTIVRRFGKDLATLQITNEPNLLGMPGSGDVSQPEVRRALVTGVLTAKAEVVASEATVKIGFNAVPPLSKTDDFWRSLLEISKRVGATPDTFASALDSVGYDIYPNVFGAPIPTPDIGAAVTFLVRNLREVNLPAAGIAPTAPIHIAENDWPTGGRPDRSEQKQAVVLEPVVRAVYGVAPAPPRVYR